VIAQWQQAWETMEASIRPGGRLAIMDAGYPEGHAPRDSPIQRPLAWALSRLFAADCDRRPWRLVGRDTRDPTSARFTGGWVTAAAGTKGAP
jgi:hypothetical protein